MAYEATACFDKDWRWWKQEEMVQDDSVLGAQSVCGSSTRRYCHGGNGDSEGEKVLHLFFLTSVE